MGRKKFIFISIIILFTIQTSACSAEGQEGQGIWHNEYESEIEIQVQRKSVKTSPKIRISHSGFWMEKKFRLAETG